MIQLQVTTALEAFASERAWVAAVQVVERFTGAALDRAIPLGPTGSAGAPRTLEAGFRPNPAGEPVLVVQATHADVRAVVEASHHFPRGALTATDRIADALARLIEALDASEALL